MRDSFFICFLTSETIMLSKITMYQYNVLLGGELMSESAAAALIEKMNGVMVLSIDRVNRPQHAHDWLGNRRAYYVHYLSCTQK